MTKVISLYGPPGAGKSTAAAGLYYFLKKKGYHCELVREYVKNWVWEGKTPGTFDQPYLWGKQLKYESICYGKVDYIITDSPCALAGFYEYLHEEDHVIQEAVFNLFNKAKKNGVEYVNYWLTPGDDYDERGRMQTKEEMVDVSEKMLKWLTDNGMDLRHISIPKDERVSYILKDLSIS
jgi:adenylate kinase family enzyme